ncbi:type 1 glutamine amidotransferase domain-containing protein [uncultured Maribacter sp.]|uniref:type 1 glutamine amidotransferase domain-containing protein n=1 Tax=uncultured Maribacter sp. TaxID=431308 RepID=UPI00260B97E1|nr:type 1 glutamine amidotransferase domain-containing protein [uncultured Maribacter sp.]
MRKGILIILTLGLFINSSAQLKKRTVKNIREKYKSTKKVLFVVTSHDVLGNTGKKTGIWIEEFAAPYYLLTDKGVEITIASPKGGQPPIDPKSELLDFKTPVTVRFNTDKVAQAKLSKTIMLAEVNTADYDAVFYPGGHGLLWDLVEDKVSIAIIETFYARNKPIGAVCLALGVFKNVKKVDGTPLVKGKKVTGFTNTEEEAVQLTNVVPFLVEDMLLDNGAIYSKGVDWKPYTVEDRLLITGQNAASSERVAEILLERLEK